jgi:hypothetical protein
MRGKVGKKEPEEDSGTESDQENEVGSLGCMGSATLFSAHRSL